METTRERQKISVPGDVYIAVGRELNLWHDTLWPAYDKNAHVVIESPAGKTTERGFRFTPDSRHANKTFPVKVKVHNAAGKRLHEFSFRLHAVPARSGTGVRRLFFIGDSLTAAGITSEEVKRLIEDDGGFQPLLLGRSGIGGNRHEGWGGWTFKSFTTQGYSLHRFTVSKIKSAPMKNFCYLHEGTAYRVQTSRLSSGKDGLLKGTIDFYARPKDNPALTQGNLPKPKKRGVLILDEIPEAWSKSGFTADAEIAFTMVEDNIPANPFWDERMNGGKGGMNIKKYMKDCLYFGGEDRIDYAFIQLGVNDSMNLAIAEQEDTAKGIKKIFLHCKNLIRGLHDPGYGYPECRIILALTSIGCNTPETYKSAPMERYEFIVRSLWDLIIKEFDGASEHPLVRVAINGLMIDRDKGFPKQAEQKGGKTIMVHNNAAHPNEFGYRQCAEAYYSVLRGWLAED